MIGQTNIDQFIDKRDHIQAARALGDLVDKIVLNGVSDLSYLLVRQCKITHVALHQRMSAVNQRIASAVISPLRLSATDRGAKAAHARPRS